MIFFISIILMGENRRKRLFARLQNFRQLSHSHFHYPLIMFILLLLGIDLTALLVSFFEFLQSLFESIYINTATLLLLLSTTADFFKCHSTDYMLIYKRVCCKCCCVVELILACACTINSRRVLYRVHPASQRIVI